jgi:aldose 1-epimerase
VIAPVDATPFDFRRDAVIGTRLAERDEQLEIAGGFDHNFILDPRGRDAAARLSDPSTGRVLEVTTTEPGLQFYTGQLLDGTIVGAYGRRLGSHAGLCLETQHFPDSPNQPQFPSTVLRPGDHYHSRTGWRFTVD